MPAHIIERVIREHRSCVLSLTLSSAASSQTALLRAYTHTQAELIVVLWDPAAWACSLLPI